MKAIFYLSLFLVFYTFIGYAIVLFFLVKFRNLIKGPRVKVLVKPDELPTCTIIVAAYNEDYLIREKVINTLELSYPPDKLKYIFVADGSTDKTPEIIAEYPQVKLLYQTARAGKISAVHRAVATVDTDVIVFTDANAFLNKASLLEICKHYADVKVGAVAGEKRVMIDSSSDATAGEGFYWKYESKLKQWDSSLNSVVGAAGELFSVRTDLYEPVSVNSILDDFMISMLIAQKGYRIVYEPNAYAVETSSANVTQELKRKIRIAAGGIQSIIWLKQLLNPFKFPVLSFQYISHRVLRWTVTPFLLIIVLVLNIWLTVTAPKALLSCVLTMQLLFYVMAAAGWVMENRQTRIKALFVPYYFCMMNYAVLAGLLKYFSGKQSSAWEKSDRKLQNQYVTNSL